jgi:long-chain acyl-CoA synthetase
MAAVQEQPKRRQQIFRWALSVGERTIPYRASGQPLPARLRIEAAVADRLVWRKLKARLGLDRVQVMLSGSAALSPAVLRFFLAINVTLVEAYGLTETSPGISGNKPSAFREGSVGEVLPGVRVRFADDGEILASGDNITPGYHRRPDDDARAFEVQDGVRWFRTGDIGHLDRDGYLFLTDRKKDLIKTSGGKFVAPQKIEGLLKGRPPITEAVVIGDGRKHCAVLVVVDEDALAAWAKRTGNKADRQSPALMAEVQAQVDAVNATLARYETLKQVRVLDDVFSVDNGLLTASFKVKRKVVAERYAAIIDGMFPHDDELA